jgi:hypothetical protein
VGIVGFTIASALGGATPTGSIGQTRIIVFPRRPGRLRRPPVLGGFSAAAQVGGRILDSRGARPSMVMGCIVAAVGFALWANQMPDRSLDSQWLWVVVAGRAWA